MNVSKEIWAYRILFVLAGIVYLIGLSTNIMGPDAGEYAEISKDMNASGSYLEVYSQGRDYLDKPPLHFWLSAASFKLFGLSNFAYRLPSFLLTILGAYSTFKLGSLLYSKKVGRLAALMLFTCIAFFMFNVDVRTDTVLVGATTFSAWQIIAYHRTKKWTHLIFGFIGAGFAMMAKGPMGLMIPALAVGTEILVNRDWKSLFDWKWLVGLSIAIITLIPMLYGLYHQWDLHPEKTLYGASNVSGVKFFFWDQSFGRLTGDNPFVQQSSEVQINDPTFFIHTLLWAFIPWSIVGFSALYKRIKQLIVGRFKTGSLPEAYTVGAIILPIVALSFSAFKLPHYIFITLPFLAIIGAHFFLEKEIRLKWIRWVQFSIGLVILAVGGLVIFTVFPTSSPVPYVALTVILSCTIMLAIGKADQLKIIVFSSMAVIFLNLILNSHFYTNLGEYDSGAKAGNIIVKQKHNGTVYSYDSRSSNSFTTLSWSLPFYGRGNHEILTNKWDVRELIGTDTYIYTSEEDLQFFIDQEWAKEIIEFDHFSVTNLTLDFLNSETRNSVTSKKYLVLL